MWNGGGRRGREVQKDRSEGRGYQGRGNEKEAEAKKRKEIEAEAEAVEDTEEDIEVEQEQEEEEDMACRSNYLVANHKENHLYEPSLQNLTADESFLCTQQPFLKFDSNFMNNRTKDPFKSVHYGWVRAHISMHCKRKQC